MKLAEVLEEKLVEVLEEESREDQLEGILEVALVLGVIGVLEVGP